MHNYYNDTYGANVYYYVGERDLKAYLKATGQASIPAVRGQCTWATEDSRLDIIIYIANKRDITAWVHECLHGTNRILSHRGVRADFLNDEPQTYLLGALLRAGRKTRE